MILSLMAMLPVLLPVPLKYIKLPFPRFKIFIQFIFIFFLAFYFSFIPQTHQPLVSFNTVILYILHALGLL
jgi:hypothetical protein